MKYYRQHDERDCGAACLAMVAARYGLTLPLSRVRELTKTDRTGTNIYGLVDGAAKLDLRAEALSGSPDELRVGIRRGEIAFPFIAHIVSEDAMLHFIVIFAEKNGKLLVGDPAKGKERWTERQFFERWTGYIVTFEKTKEFRPGKQSRGSLRMFFALLRGQYHLLIGALLLSLPIAAIGIASAFVFQIIIDGFTDTGGTQTTGAFAEFLQGISLSDVGGIFAAIIVLYLVQAAIQAARGYLIVLTAQKIDVRLTMTYYNHIMNLPVSSIAVRQTGEYLSRFSDADTIRNAVSTATLTLVLDSLMVVACGAILYAQNSRVFCAALLVIVLYTAIVLCYRRPVERANRAVMERNAVVQSYFKETIDGANTIKAACAEEQVKATTAAKFRRFLDAAMRSSMLSMTQDILADSTQLIGTVAILWIGFAMVLEGTITLGSLMTCYALLGYFIEPIKNLIELQPTIQTALVAADRLRDILDMQPEDAGEATRLPPVERWELRNINFRYGNRELTLRDVTLTIRRGEKIAIVGESGSGKTTLARLLLRFYEPERGVLLLDGKPARELSLTALRQSVAYVEQNTFLFADTVRNNLKLGRADISDEELRQACREAQIDAVIEQLPLGYDTPLDENGANLSGGQRQRLAIARALLKKPQLLILDEATSHLDTITEAAIQDTIFRLDSGMTCLVIAHRLSTIRQCDRIFVMEHGRIIEQGTHEELIGRENGRYAKLWRT